MIREEDMKQIGDVPGSRADGDVQAAQEEGEGMTNRQLRDEVAGARIVMVSLSLPTGPAPALPLSVTVNRIEREPRSLLVGVHWNTALPYRTPGVRDAPAGNESAENVSTSWSRSEAFNVNCSN